MTIQYDRLVGGAFSPAEGELLDLLCSGKDSQSSLAREQRVTATWGGYEHEGCGCFLISVTTREGNPLIVHDGGPFSMAEVSDGMETLGMLELWVVDGLLHSVNYMPFGDDHVALPTAEDYKITLIGPE